MANVSPQASASLRSFNATTAEDAKRDVFACCASRRFASAVADGRPYPDADALLTAVDAAFTALSWDDIVEAMNEHPRIGDRAVRGGMSAAEQSGASAASDEVRQGLADGNLAYEQRFGHIFLICASGMSGQEMLEQLRARLEHDDEAERTVVREELRKITRLRMTKMLNL
jgi:2-oxo-4-hydroxy-4-carboxy-5-ureidoimidazoline decarboxylase